MIEEQSHVLLVLSCIVSLESMADHSSVTGEMKLEAIDEYVQTIIFSPIAEITFVGSEATNH